LVYSRSEECGKLEIGFLCVFVVIIITVGVVYLTWYDVNRVVGCGVKDNGLLLFIEGKQQFKNSTEICEEYRGAILPIGDLNDKIQQVVNKVSVKIPRGSYYSTCKNPVSTAPTSV